MDENRGVINNRERAKQIRDFSGLQYANKITPTDIDGMIEFGDKAFVFMELKFGNKDLPYGQRLALERLTDNMENAGKFSIAIIATHNADVYFDIDVAECYVTERRINKQWKIAHHETVKEMIDKFLKLIKMENYIK